MSRKAAAVFVLCGVLYGTPYLFNDIAIDTFGPWFIAWTRSVAGALTLGALAWRSGALDDLRGRWPWLIGISVTNNALPWVLISIGQRHVTSSLTGLLTSVQPLSVALFALVIDRRERVGGWRLMGLFIGLGGLACVMGLDIGGDEKAVLGATLIVASTAMWGLGALLMPRVSGGGAQPLLVSSLLLAVAAAALTPFAAFDLPSEAPSVGEAVNLFVLATLCTGLPLATYVWLLDEIGASRTSVITYVSPVISVLLGWSILGDPLTGAMLAGFVLILVGSWLATRGKPHEEAVEPPPSVPYPPPLARELR